MTPKMLAFKNNNTTYTSQISEQLNCLTYDEIHHVTGGIGHVLYMLLYNNNIKRHFVQLSAGGAFKAWVTSCAGRHQ